MHNGAESVGSSNTPVYSRGFTIVELLVVIVVIGILAAITIVSYTGITQKATVASLQSDLTNAANLLKMDQVVSSGYPISLAVANNNKGVPHSPDVTYDSYFYNNNTSPQTFCLTASKNGTSYKITNNSGSVVGACESAIVTDSLLVNLDAGNTASYSGSGTTWTDLTGNANHGTLVNSVGYSNNGNGGSLTFDGVSKYVTVGSMLFNNSAAGTVNMWVNPTANGSLGSQPYYAPAIFANDGTYAALLLINTNKIRNYFWTGAQNYYDSNTALPINAWSLVTFTWNSSGSNIYINGNLDASSATLTWTNVLWSGGATTTAQIGRHSATGYSNLYFNGAIGNFGIYSRALTPSEVLQNYNALKGRYGY